MYPVFQRNMKAVFNDNKYNSVLFEFDHTGYYFNIKAIINIKYQFKTIEDILEIYNKKVELVYSLTSKEIVRQNLLSGTVSLKFNFPKHLKDLCKQYLSYFGKFLSDHNIDCELSLIDQDDITYMTINVDETKVDIDELQQALVGYFSLPAISPENIATQQLIANI